MKKCFDPYAIYTEISIGTPTPRNERPLFTNSSYRLVLKKVSAFGVTLLDLSVRLPVMGSNLRWLIFQEPHLLSFANALYCKLFWNLKDLNKIIIYKKNGEMQVLRTEGCCFWWSNPLAAHTSFQSRSFTPFQIFQILFLSTTFLSTQFLSTINLFGISITYCNISHFFYFHNKLEWWSTHNIWFKAELIKWNENWQFWLK